MLQPSLFCGMPENSQSVSAVIRFGPFDADLQTQELRKHGVRLRLPRQSFQILKMLLDRPGSLITREELRQVLWASDTFVDFDHGLNAAVNRLREVLGDSADEPRLVETLPRRGYRFIGEIAVPTAVPEIRIAPPVVTSPATAEVLSRVHTRWTPPKILASLLGAILCFALAVFAFLNWRHRSESHSLTAVPFTALPGWADFPAFSPDGSRIAFSWIEASRYASKDVNLYVKKIGSENLLRLTSHSSDLIAPAWSPDGKQIAFQRLSKGEGGIYVIPAEGGAERKLRSTHASFGQSMSISWSLDRKTIAFADSPVPGGHRRLQLLSLETLESRQIEHDEKCQEEGLPTFSPDGKQLAYACFPTTGDFALSIATSEGLAPRLIKQFPGWLNGLAWTGDNKRLLFLHMQTGDDHERLSELTVGDASVRDLPIGPVGGTLAVSTSGDRLAYTVGSSHNNIWRGDLLHPQTSPVRLISTTRNEACPQYSPDGKHIAFCSDRGGSGEIWMSDPDGTSVVRLTDVKNLGAGSPSWSPDSTKIVFDSRTEIHPGQHHADLYIVDIAERVPRKLNTGTDQASVPSWSHDGKWIYFMGGGDDAAGERIFRVAPEGGRAQVLTSATGYGPRESFDGQSVYFARHSGSTTTLEVASLNPTGTEFRVEGLPPLSFGANWTLVRDGVYFFPAEDFVTLSYFDFASKRARPVFKVSSGVFYGSSVSPDGRYILYAQIEDARNDIMLVNGLR
jgi:Tol biopolymer transport system component/DNA-binding winged helix-turn-helix (wHTH) protein